MYPKDDPLLKSTWILRVSRPDRQSLPRASRPRLLDIRSGWAIWLGLRPDDNYYYRIGAGIPKEPSLARCAARLLIVVAATPIAALLIYLLTDLQRELQVNALLACWLAYIWLRELTASIDAAGAERRARRRGDAHLPAEFRLAAARGSRAPLGGAPGVA